MRTPEGPLGSHDAHWGLRGRRVALKRFARAADLEPGREVEIDLTQGTRVGGRVIQSDEQGVVLERAESQDRARIAATEIADVLIVAADPPA